MPGTTNAEVIGLPLADAISLSDFLISRQPLTVADRQTIVQQGIGLLEHVYVHLPVKKHLYGIDPVRRLRELEKRLTSDPEVRNDDLAFHREMVAIFTE